MQIRSASPHYVREDRSYHSTQSQTPSLRSNYSFNAAMLHHQQHPRGSTSGGGGGAMPNYMAATESAKARVRSQSAPRQRPSTPERERERERERDRSGSAKKRLSFPVPDPNGQDLRSPSFTSVNEAYAYMAHQSNYSSYYTESIAGGEVSPCSTTDLRRWLR
ncbi:hypothetical protein LXL04_026617 [Taraxacum kok-saghyz]